MSYRYIFGPVLSRRFGVSLGIDLSPDFKSCNFDCIYCELEASKPTSFIKNPPKVEDILKELKKALDEFKEADVITITSNGEPTLYKDLQKLIEEINKVKKDKKLLILSNSSMIVSPKIREILKDVDIAKLSLDCVSERCFKKIDRPLKDISIKEIIEGLKKFREEFDKDLVIEILVVAGINDKIEEMKKLNEVLKEIKPDRVDIGTIDRPPAYKVLPVSMEKLKSLAEVFENLPISISYKKDYEVSQKDFTEDEILALLKRRPQTGEDIKRQFSSKSKEILSNMLKNGIVKTKEVAGVLFYSLA